MDDLSGRTIKGYEIREQIGAGGLGAVYRSYQPVVAREVAVKVILPQFANQPDFIRRFEIEAQLVARLEHPFIVPLYDYWRDPDGAYLVMRYLRGGSLRQVLQIQGSLAVDQAARILDQITAALATAHRHDVIHRDLKPDNILLDEDENAYLSDFGIAKILNTDTRITQEEGIVGSPNYLAPEQARGEPVTPQTDIYSLGIVLYEMLVGKPPFQADSWVDLLTQHLSEPVPPLGAQFSDGLNAVIQRATTKVPADRFPNAAAFAEAFRNALSDVGSSLLRSEHETVGSLQEEITVVPQLSGMPVSATVADQTTWVSRVLSDIESPYKGLRPFQEVDAVDFYGREKLTGRLVKRLAEQGVSSRFLAVIGPSGSGKSSLVKAGLVPQIRQGALPGSEQWFVVEMSPGPYPFEELEAALLRVAAHKPTGLLRQLKADRHGLLRAISRAIPLDDQAEILLIIDQFEELFTLVEEETTRTQFIASLLTAVVESRGHLRVIVTLRADFYDRPLQYPALGELIRQRNEVVLPLATKELEEVIVKPAARVGLSLEPGLAAAIVNDVTEQPGALPLLQYALTELFERREGRILTLKAYRDSGGVMGALASRADELYGSLDAEERAAARQVFLRLVALGESAEDTRRRVLQSEMVTITDSRSLERILNLYGRYRLLTFDRDPVTRSPTVEVAHEALLRSWGRLRQWIDDSREGIQILRRLTLAAQEWAGSNQDPSFLATGARLEQFQNWATHTDLSMNKVEAAYFKASIDYSRVRRARDEARKAREAELQNQARTRLRFVVGLVMSLVAAFAVMVLVLVQQSQTEEARSLAVVGQNLANTQSVALERTAFQLETAQQQLAEVPNYIATLASQPELEEVLSSLQQAIEADQFWRRGDAEQAAVLAVEANHLEHPPPIAQRILGEIGYGPIIRYAANSVSNGSTEAGVGLSNAATIRAVSPDGGIVFLSNGRLVDTTSGYVFRRLGEWHSSYDWYPTPLPMAPITHAVFSPDGHMLTTGQDGGEVALWHVPSGALLWRETGHRAPITALAFSPDGQSIVTGASDASLLIWDTMTGDLLRQFRGLQSAVSSVAVSDSGHVVSLSASDGMVIWDRSTGAIVQLLEIPGGDATVAAVSPNGVIVLYGQSDGSVTVWNLGQGTIVTRQSAHQASVQMLAVDRYGESVLSAAEDGSLAILNLATGNIVSRYQVPVSDGSAPVISADLMTDTGRYSIAGMSDARLLTLRYVDAAASVELADYDIPISNVFLSADGGIALVRTYDGNWITWDVDRSTATSHFESQDWLTSVAALSPEGQYAAIGTHDHTILLIETASGGGVWQSTSFVDPVADVGFSSDGREILVITHGYQTPLQMTLIDVETGISIAEQTIQLPVVQAAAIYDRRAGNWLVVASIEDGRLFAWRLREGELVPDRQMLGGLSNLQSIEICGDGSHFLARGGDGTIDIWHLQSGDLVDELVDFMQGVCLSGEGRIFVQDNDAVWWLWDTGAKDVVRRLPEFYGVVNTLAMSDDDGTALVGLADGRFIRWSLPSREELVSLVEDRYADLVATYVSYELHLRPVVTSEANPYHLETAMSGDVRRLDAQATAQARAANYTATAALQYSFSELTGIPGTQTQMAVGGLQRFTLTPTASSTPTQTLSNTPTTVPTFTASPVAVPPTPVMLP